MAQRLNIVIGVIAIAVAGLIGAGPAFGSTSTTGRISGVAFEDVDHDGVRDAGEPVFAGHSIYLMTQGGTSFVAQSTTDATGRYSFDSLPAATYRVAYNSSTWNPLRNDWFPTTTSIASPPWTEVAVAGDVTFDWGLRRIVRSTDPAAPITEFRGPSGLLVQSYVDVVPAQQVHDALASGFLGAEAASITVRFGFGSTNMTNSSTAQSNGQYVSFTSLSHSTYLAWAGSGGSWTTVSHEYGHAWSDYHSTMTQQTGNFDRYLEARGLSGDPRVGTTYAWMPQEMIAEDYRQLLGPSSGRGATQINTEIPRAADVPGLRDFLTTTFASSPPSWAPPPTTTDTTAPTTSVVNPGSGATVGGTTDAAAVAVDDRTSAGALVVAFVIDGRSTLTATYNASDGRYHAAWDTRTVTDGTHTVVAVVTDAAGNTSTSEAVTTTVRNSKTKPGATTRPRK